MRRSGFLESLLALCCLAGLPAWAADCTVPVAAASDAQLDQLLQRLPDCQRDANYLAGLGQLLNERGRYVEAAEHLERALLLAPEQKGTQVDYAIALAGVGDIASALSLVDSLLAEPDLPQALRPVLERQRAVWAQGPGTQFRFVLNTRFGYDSNLLGSPNLSALTLTFPGQTVVLPLEGYQRRGGLYGRLDAQVEGRRDLGTTARWDFFAGARSRRSGSVSEAGSDQLDAGVQFNNYQRSADPWGLYGGMSASRLRTRTGIEYTSTGISFGIGGMQWPRQCDARLGIDVQDRNYRSNPVLSGRYSGVSAVWSCEAAPRFQWLASFKAGVDAARDDQRPGGDQNQFSLRAAGVWSGVGFGERRNGHVLLDADLSVSNDRSGYSPLLESGRLREVRRATLRAEYQQPLSPSLQWIAGAEWTVQRSSLVLFSSRSWGPYVALRSVW